MRSIERRFNNLQEKRPHHSSLINLAGAVSGQRFSSDRISRALTNLVEKDDYSRKDRPAILRHLINLTNDTRAAEAYRKQGKDRPTTGTSA